MSPCVCHVQLLAIIMEWWQIRVGNRVHHRLLHHRLIYYDTTGIHYRNSSCLRWSRRTAALLPYCYRTVWAKNLSKAKACVSLGYMFVWQLPCHWKWARTIERGRWAAMWCENMFVRTRLFVQQSVSKQFCSYMLTWLIIDQFRSCDLLHACYLLIYVTWVTLKT